MPDDTPPELTCPQSFVIELVDEKAEYPVNFRNLRPQVNTSDPSGEVTVTFSPERAVIKTGDYENVTVYARDKNDNVATCQDCEMSFASETSERVQSENSVGIVYHPTWLKECQRLPQIPKNRVSRSLMYVRT